MQPTSAPLMDVLHDGFRDSCPDFAWLRGIPDDTGIASDLYLFQDKYTGNSLMSSCYGSSPVVYGYAYYHQDYDPEHYIYNEDLVRSGKLGEEYMFVNHSWQKGGSPGQHIPTTVCYETMPDIFRFSGPGIRGSFVLQPGGSAIFYDTDGSPYAYSVSFGLNGSGFTEFGITTPERYVYTYGQCDLCTSTSQLTDTNDNITTPGSWRLTRIDAPDGRYVLFIYGARNVGQSGQHVRCQDDAFWEPRDAAPDEDGTDSGMTYAGDGVSWSETRSDCLTQVRVCNSDGKAVCTMSMTYINGVLENGALSTDCKKLSSVTVKNIDGRTVRRCTLSYEVVYDPVLTGRGVTLLSSVSTEGEGTTSFSYYGNDAGAVSPSTRFPAMTTLGVDWYGYYNPSVTSGSFAPGMATAKASTDDTWLLTMRQPDLAGTRLGMLRSVTYPTGGSATYEYELNRYSLDLTGLDKSPVGTASGLRVSGVTVRERDGSVVQRRTFTYGSSLQSSGTLLRRPSIYIHYRLESSGYRVIEHRSVSTASDLYYGVSPHIEYTDVTERITGADGPQGDACEIEYGYSTGADGVLGNSYGDASFLYDNGTLAFSCHSIEDTNRHNHLFHAIRGVQDYSGGGRLLYRKEYSIKSGVRRPVRSESYTYEPWRNSYPVDVTAETFCLSLFTDYTYRFTSPRLRQHVISEYGSDGTPLRSRTERFSYDALQRPVESSVDGGDGSTVSVRYVWDGSCPWLLKERSGYRGGLQMWGERYGWRRPDYSEYPQWWVPYTLDRTGVTLERVEDEDEEPWDYTSASWYRVASFSEYNDAGNPCVVKDSRNRVTHYSWDASGLNPASVTRYPEGVDGPALTTRFSWVPLVGVTSVTHPAERWSVTNTITTGGWSVSLIRPTRPL